LSKARLEITIGLLDHLARDPLEEEIADPVHRTPNKAKQVEQKANRIGQEVEGIIEMRRDSGDYGGWAMRRLLEAAGHFNDIEKDETGHNRCNYKTNHRGGRK
jgi:hypothetical protein